MTTGRLPSVEGGIQPTIVDAKGDLIAATAADTVSRIAVGANDTVLTADSSTATGLKWATPSSGGMTLLSTSTLPNNASSLDITSINQNYNSLFILIYNVTTASNTRFALSPNSSGNFYATGFANGSTTAVDQTNSDIQLTGNAGNNMLSTGGNNAWVITIDNYASTTDYKPVNIYGIYEKSGPTTVITSFSGGIATDSAISSILVYTVGNMSGGTVKMYGVK